MAYDGPYSIEPSVADFLNREHRLFIEGAAAASTGSATMPVYDPSSAKVIAKVVDATAQDVDAAVQSAARAFRDRRWRGLRPADRERILFKFADLVVERGEVFAQLETLEQGKSINISRMFEVGASSEWMRYVAGLTTKLQGATFDTSLPGGPDHWTTYTRREPVGVVAGIAPWNFPMMIALWKVMPALAAGCSIVLKPSETTPLTALLLAETALEAGVPPGVFNVVTGAGAGAGAALVTHRDVAKVTFTGSTATGVAISQAAAPSVKNLTLELGGKNPAIVLNDADLGGVVNGLMIGGFLNGGQVCASSSRVYAEAGIYDKLVETLEGAVGGMSVGPGLDPGAQINPLVSAAHRQKVKAYLDDARAQGARVIEGAAVPDEGYYIRPTLVLNPGDNVKLTREEVFGPVIGVTRVDSAEEAVRRANDSELGLGASLWTQNLTAAMNLVPQIEAGTVWVNAHVFIDPAMPFGGYKKSGVGRDFGTEWLHGYTEVKSVCIAH